MELLLLITLAVLVVHALDRNNHHTPDHPHLHGSTDVENRDRARMQTDLPAS